MMDLKPREIELLRLLVDGLSMKAAARKMGLEYETAKNHSKTMRARLQAKTCAQAAAVAVRRGLL